MKWTKAIGLSLMLMGMSAVAVSCREKSVNDVPPEEAALRQSVEQLQLRHYRQYVDMLDFGKPLDSLQLAWRTQAVAQYAERLRKQHGGVQGIRVCATDKTDDLRLTLHYYLYFADGDSDLCSQPMVKCNGEWKLKVD